MAIIVKKEIKWKEKGDIKNEPLRMLQEHSHKMELMLPCSSETVYGKRKGKQKIHI